MRCKALLSAVIIAMFVGCGAMILLASADVFPWLAPEPVWVFFVIGFISMTLPVATRELTKRSAPETAEQ